MFTEPSLSVAQLCAAAGSPFDPAIKAMAEEVLADAGDLYERDLYCLSNFSAFRLRWKGMIFDTSEHAYHWEKFNTDLSRAKYIQDHILHRCFSAHEAYEVAQREREYRRADWDRVLDNGRPPKLHVMKAILREKVHQHPYVEKKLLQAHRRGLKITERSWRDSFWGTGPDGTGEDWMGRLWTELAEEMSS